MFFYICLLTDFLVNPLCLTEQYSLVLATRHLARTWPRALLVVKATLPVCVLLVFKDQLAHQVPVLVSNFKYILNKLCQKFGCIWWICWATCLEMVKWNYKVYIKNPYNNVCRNFLTLFWFQLQERLKTHSDCSREFFLVRFIVDVSRALILGSNCSEVSLSFIVVYSRRDFNPQL